MGNIIKKCCLEQNDQKYDHLLSIKSLSIKKN